MSSGMHALPGKGTVARKAIRYPVTLPSPHYLPTNLDATVTVAGETRCQLQ